MSDIVIDFERLKNPNTGLYSFSKDLGKELLANANDVQLTFFLPKSEVNLFEKSSKIIFNPIHKIFKPRKNDLWHLTHQGSKFGGNKNLLTIHDLNFLVEKKGNLAKIKNNLRIIQDNINRSQQIVCISNFTSSQVQEYLKIDNKPISVIYNGCSLENYPDFNEPIYRPQNKFLFSIGTVFRKKNFHVLSNLLINNDFELVIAGILSDRKYVEEILNNAKKNGVASRLHLVGAISDQEKFWYYKNCTAFVFPSIAEGFGLPVVEAMRLGKPVFLSRLNSLPEVGGENAFYFDDFDQESMLRTFELAVPQFDNDELKEKLIQHSMQFSWESAAKKYLKIYKTML